MSNKNIARLIFIGFTIILAVLMVTRVIEVPGFIAIWIPGLVVFTGAMKKMKKKEAEQPGA